MAVAENKTRVIASMYKDTENKLLEMVNSSTMKKSEFIEYLIERYYHDEYLESAKVKNEQ